LTISPSPHIVSLIEELKKIKPALGTLIDPLLTVVTQAKVIELNKL
jgi:hypothetical protein